MWGVGAVLGTGAPGLQVDSKAHAAPGRGLCAAVLHPVRLSAGSDGCRQHTYHNPHQPTPTLQFSHTLQAGMLGIEAHSEVRLASQKESGGAKSAHAGREGV